MYKRHVNCYQCKFEHTEKCNSCDESFSNLELREGFTWHPIRKDLMDK